MTNGEHAKQIDAFDPLGSIFLPRTRNLGAVALQEGEW